MRNNYLKVLSTSLPIATFIIHAVKNHLVRIEVTVGGTIVGTFSVDPGEPSAEKTLAVRLSALGCRYSVPEGRELDVQRLFAACCRALLPSSQSDGEDECNEVLRTTTLRDRVYDDMIKLGYGADPSTGVLLYLVKTSALLDKPIFAYITGPASSLKTSYADLAAHLTPEESRRHLTDLTPKALYYGSDVSHFLIALDEMDLKARGLATDLKILRMLHSKGWCEIEVTLGRSTERRRVQGPVAVIQTTVATRFDEQDLSRHLTIELADCPQRAQSVLGTMARGYAGKEDLEGRESIAELHRDIHRMLPPGAAIVVPFAEAIAQRLSAQRMVVLRAYGILMSLIKSSALLHFRQREVDEKGRIVADIEDYRWVHDIGSECIGQSMCVNYLPNPARKWLEKLLRAMARIHTLEEYDDWAALGSTGYIDKGRRWDEPKPITELVDLSETPRATIQRYLDQLIAAGIVDRTKSRRAYGYCLTDPKGELPTCPQLPSPDDVMNEHLGSRGIVYFAPIADDEWRLNESEHASGPKCQDLPPPIVFEGDPEFCGVNDSVHNSLEKDAIPNTEIS